jgi:hypothetical protein
MLADFDAKYRQHLRPFFFERLLATPMFLIRPALSASHRETRWLLDIALFRVRREAGESEYRYRNFRTPAFSDGLKTARRAAETSLPQA